jgi:transposase
MSPDHEGIVATKILENNPTDIGCSNKNATIEASSETPNQWCQMDMRELKGLEIAARCQIAFVGGFWQVPSQSGSGKYRVTLNPASCTCEDFTLRQQPCKHVHAARLTCERDHGGKPPAIDTDVVPKKPTYAQVWPAYNEAQAHEKERFEVLLHDLCMGIPEPSREGKTGRRPHLLRDAVFAMVSKVYSTFSSRRSSTDLRESHAKGFTTVEVPGAKVTAFHESPAFTPILRELIAVSARPLRAVETEFAIDSSGFSSSKFERWFDHKYGVTRQKCVWIKVHVSVGVQTNIVTAVRILDKDAADCPQFVPLLEETAATFKIGEFSGDKAYASLENFEAVAGFGGAGFFAFKTNATGGVGGMFEQMFHYFQFRRDDFLKHYHKRSNVESTFSSVKRKFGDSVRSKTDTAMVNEVLCKFLAHNICCVIQEQAELGIEPVFWGEKPAPPMPSVLPFVRPG